MSNKSRHKKANYLPLILFVAGVLMLAAVLLLFKAGSNNRAQATKVAGDLPANQLQNALAANRPTLAFFHSNNCQQCIVMMGIVSKVYPEFTDSVTLVDVNVYDKKNEALLKRVGLQYIPTLIFFDRAGQGKVSVGVMEDEQFRQTLVNLAGGE